MPIVYDPTTMGIITKMDAVERFRPLMKTGYSGRVSGSGFIDENKEPVNMCGVIIAGNYAYASNNHFVGKIFIPDNMPPQKPTYWDYTEGNEMLAIKEPPTNNIAGGEETDTPQKSLFYDYNTGAWSDNKQFERIFDDQLKILKQFFFNYRGNLIKFKKDTLLELIRDIYGRNDREKAANVAFIRPVPEHETIRFNFLRIARRNEEKEVDVSIPMHLAEGRSAFSDYSQNAMCSVNVFYLSQILETFLEFDVVDFCFDNDPSIPVVIKGVNPRVSWKPDIRFALAQALPKYKVDFLTDQ